MSMSVSERLTMFRLHLLWRMFRFAHKHPALTATAPGRYYAHFLRHLRDKGEQELRTQRQTGRGFVLLYSVHPETGNVSPLPPIDLAQLPRCACTCGCDEVLMEGYATMLSTGERVCNNCYYLCLEHDVPHLSW
ncbi:hypothetical protein [Ktedonospora formicarum]|uniref:hypothetical protein n=1 Tax=Ktedonospora formicarum TaxID=2778364 RepID=UPI001C689424|nr:hypothetical protein [Ktedonospora formicarum]